jgi:hypothetical protein
VLDARVSSFFSPSTRLRSPRSLRATIVVPYFLDLPLTSTVAWPASAYAGAFVRTSRRLVS